MQWLYSLIHHFKPHKSGIAGKVTFCKWLANGCQELGAHQGDCVLGFLEDLANEALWNGVAGMGVAGKGVAGIVE